VDFIRLGREHVDNRLVEGFLDDVFGNEGLVSAKAGHLLSALLTDRADIVDGAFDEHRLALICGFLDAHLASTEQ